MVWMSNMPISLTVIFVLCLPLFAYCLIKRPWLPYLLGALIGGVGWGLMSAIWMDSTEPFSLCGTGYVRFKGEVVFYASLLGAYLTVIAVVIYRNLFCRSSLENTDSSDT
jgi:hypothetical protein